MSAYIGQLAAALLVLLFTASVAWAPPLGLGVGGDNEWSENAKTLFRIKLSGVINTQPEEQTLQARANLSTQTRCTDWCFLRGGGAAARTDPRRPRGHSLAPQSRPGG